MGISSSNTFEFILGARYSGKTTKLIKISAAEGRYILTTTKTRARSIFDQAMSMGYDIPYPVTWEEFQNGRFQGSYIQKDGLLIDDADELLSYIFNGIPIRAVTWTNCGITNLDYKPIHGGVYEVYPLVNKDGYIRELERKLKESEGLREKAYHVIGQVVDKPNPFE